MMVGGAARVQVRDPCSLTLKLFSFLIFAAVKVIPLVYLWTGRVLIKSPNLLWVSFWFIFIIDYVIALFLLCVCIYTYISIYTLHVSHDIVQYLPEEKGAICPTAYMWCQILVPICLYCLNCTKFGQLILRKIIKIGAHRAM